MRPGLLIRLYALAWTITVLITVVAASWVDKGDARGICVSCWERVAGCESGHRWFISTGNGYFGGLQFTLSTWRGMGGRGYPHQNSRWTQILIAERLRLRAGLSPWPVCGRRYYG